MFVYCVLPTSIFSQITIVATPVIQLKCMPCRNRVVLITKYNQIHLKSCQNWSGHKTTRLFSLILPCSYCCSTNKWRNLEEKSVIIRQGISFVHHVVQLWSDFRSNIVFITQLCNIKGKYNWRSGTSNEDISSCNYHGYT
jgi:hypothetical protein